MEEKITKEMMEAKDKAFAENNKIIEKQEVQIFLWKGLSILFGLVGIAVVVVCGLLCFFNGKKINELEDEVFCLTGQMKEETLLKEQAIDLLKNIDRYILEDYEENSGSDGNIVKKMRSEIEAICNPKLEEQLLPVSPGNPWEMQIDKPIIYFENAPEKEITVTLGYPKKLTCSYPKYENGWKFTVSKDGNVQMDGKNYYGLYWEGTGAVVNEIKNGFCVKGEETADFLEKYLKILGLSEKEANEFIIYWLPKMEKNKYNLVYFATMEEQQSYMPIAISPAPETIIRVNMVWKASDEFVDIKAEELTPVKREGYTVVEWGGTELK